MNQMKRSEFTILSNRPLNGAVFRMTLRGDTSAIVRPGQFVNVALSGRFLRRPISVCLWDEETLTLVYKTVGDGTRQMAAMTAGQTLDLLTGLGNGYDTAKAGDSPLLIGGGVGVPPLVGLARALRSEGRDVAAVLGFNTAAERMLEEDLLGMGVRVTVTTVDGSAGVKGFVTDALPDGYSYTYACGPEPMLRAVYKASVTSGQYSFEERMGCGFGACMGCSCRTVTGWKRICREGPVLEKEEILWK